MSKIIEANKVRLTHRVAAEVLGVSTRTLDRWVNDGLITPIRVRTHKYYIADDVYSFGQPKATAAE